MRYCQVPNNTGRVLTNATPIIPKTVPKNPYTYGGAAHHRSAMISVNNITTCYLQNKVK